MASSSGGSRTPTAISRGTNPGLGSIAVTPDGRRILSAGESTVPITQTKLKYGPRNVTLTEIRLWDLETGERVQDLQAGEDARPRICGAVARRPACGGGRFRRAPDPRRRDGPIGADDPPARVWAESARLLSRRDPCRHGHRQRRRHLRRADRPTAAPRRTDTRGLPRSCGLVTDRRSDRHRS